MQTLGIVIKNKEWVYQAPPSELSLASEAVPFPSMRATSLAGEETRLCTAEGGQLHGRVTLLGCAGSQFAQPMVDGWLEPFFNMGSDEHQVIWLSLVHGTLLNWFRKPLVASMRASVERERHRSFFCHFGDSDVQRERLRMENRYLGYVCIVDRNGLVRWHTHSNQPPDGDGEIDSLARLLREAREREPGRGSSSAQS